MASVVSKWSKGQLSVAPPTLDVIKKMSSVGLIAEFVGKVATLFGLLLIAALLVLHLINADGVYRYLSAWGSVALITMVAVAAHSLRVAGLQPLEWTAIERLLTEGHYEPISVEVRTYIRSVVNQGRNLTEAEWVQCFPCDVLSKMEFDALSRIAEQLTRVDGTNGGVKQP